MEIEVLSCSWGARIRGVRVTDLDEDGFLMLRNAIRQHARSCDIAREAPAVTTPTLALSYVTPRYRMTGFSSLYSTRR